MYRCLRLNRRMSPLISSAESAARACDRERTTAELAVSTTYEPIPLLAQIGLSTFLDCNWHELPVRGDQVAWAAERHPMLAYASTTAGISA